MSPPQIGKQGFLNKFAIPDAAIKAACGGHIEGVSSNASVCSVKDLFEVLLELL